MLLELLLQFGNLGFQGFDLKAVLTQHLDLEETELNYEFACSLGQDLDLSSFECALELYDVAEWRDLNFAHVGNLVVDLQ